MSPRRRRRTSVRASARSRARARASRGRRRRVARAPGPRRASAVANGIREGRLAGAARSVDEHERRPGCRGSPRVRRAPRRPSARRRDRRRGRPAALAASAACHDQMTFQLPVAIAAVADAAATRHPTAMTTHSVRPKCAVRAQVRSPRRPESARLHRRREGAPPPDREHEQGERLAERAPDHAAIGDAACTPGEAEGAPVVDRRARRAGAPRAPRARTWPAGAASGRARRRGRSGRS